VPCTNPERTPSARELETQRVASYLLYLADDCEGIILLSDTDRSYLQEAVNPGSDCFNHDKLDHWTNMLCSTLRQMTEQGLTDCVYNGRNKKARALACWWDDHEIWDKERIEQERLETEHPLAVATDLVRYCLMNREVQGISNIMSDGDLEEPELSCTINGREYMIEIRPINDNDEEL